MKTHGLSMAQIYRAHTGSIIDLWWTDGKANHRANICTRAFRADRFHLLTMMQRLHEPKLVSLCKLAFNNVVLR